MKTISFTARTPDEIKAELNKIKDSDFSPKIAFVFSTEQLGIQKIASAFSGSGLSVLGCSSGGSILAQDHGNVIFEDAAVITLVDINKDYFAYKILDRKDRSSWQMGEDIGKWGASKFENPAFLLCASGLSLNGQELVEGVLGAAGQDTVMFGGLASDDARFTNNYVFSGDTVLESGVVSIAFDTTKVEIHGLATSGWVGLGKDLVITSSESNIVYSIDNEPALRVYKRYLSVEDTDLPAIGIEYPLLIKRDNHNYALRAVMGVDREKESLIFAGSVPQDSIVTFSSSPGFEVMDRTKEQIEKFYNKHTKADMILLFSCMARHLALGPVITEEISFPSEKWGVPVTGFLTYGEIGTNCDQRCDFFNQTYTLVLIKEK